MIVIIVLVVSSNSDNFSFTFFYMNLMKRFIFAEYLLCSHVAFFWAWSSFSTDIWHDNQLR